MLTPNIAKGRVAYYASLPAASDALRWVLLTGTETDDNLRDADTLTAILALAVDEATFTGYTRVTATGVTVTVDDVLDWVTADAADPSWSPTSAQALTRIVLCYDPDTTTGTDADLIPLYIDTYPVTTPTTGTITYTVPASGFYSEGDPAVTALVSLEDAKAETNITSTTSDAELRSYILAASAVLLNHPDYRVADVCQVNTYTEWTDAGSDSVVLKHYPVTAVTSVTEYTSGTAQVIAAEPLAAGVFTGYGWDYEDGTGANGILVRLSSGSQVRWRGNRVKVVYTAGSASVPQDVRLACLELVRFMWQQSQGAGTQTYGEPDFGLPTPFGIPNSVTDKLIGYRRGPVTA